MMVSNMTVLNVNLKSHIRNVHEIPKYTCGQCEYKSAQKDTLKKQIETVHDGKRHPPH